MSPIVLENGFPEMSEDVRLQFLWQSLALESLGLHTGDKLQKVKSKVTKHPIRRPRNVIIGTLSTKASPVISEQCCSTLLLSSTDTHQYTHQYPISR